MQLAALAPKAEVHVRADHFNMSVSQGCQAEGAVLLSILLIANSDSGLLEQPDNRRQHLLSRHAGPFQVAVGPLADLWQGRGKGHHPVVLDGIANLAPAQVIAVLFAPPGVAPRRLQMAVRVGADPDIGPGRRHGQAFDPPDRIPVIDGAALAGAIHEALPGALPADPRTQIRDVAESRGARRFDRLDQINRGRHSSPHSWSSSTH